MQNLVLLVSVSDPCAIFSCKCSSEARPTFDRKSHRYLIDFTKDDGLFPTLHDTEPASRYSTFARRHRVIRFADPA
jgi:hypothetical protein